MQSIRRQQAEKTEKAVLAFYRKYRAANLQTSPSLPMVAKACGLAARSSVRKVLNRLIKRGQMKFISATRTYVPV